MNFSTFIQKLVGKVPEEELFSWKTTPKGLTFYLDDKLSSQIEQLAFKNKLLSLQLVNLNMLYEQGLAQKTAEGYEIPAAIVATLDQDFRTLFKLPPYFDGRFALETQGITSQPDFDVSLKIFKDYELPGAHLDGPFLKVGNQTYYSLTEAQWTALNAIEKFHTKAPQSRTAFDNNLLIHTLKRSLQRDQAKRAAKTNTKARPDLTTPDEQSQLNALTSLKDLSDETDFTDVTDSPEDLASNELSDLPPLKLNLAHFENLHTQLPESVSLAAEEDAEGNLTVYPSFDNCSTDDIAKRLGQVPRDDQASVMHIKDQVVLLQPQITHAVNQIRTFSKINKQDIPAFLESPTAFFQDPHIELDSGFSLRVNGAEKFTQRYFGDLLYQDNRWFTGIKGGYKPLVELEYCISSLEEYKELEKKVHQALENSYNTIEFGGQTFTLEGPIDPRKVLERIYENLTALHVFKKKEDPYIVKIKNNDDKLDYATYDPQSTLAKHDVHFSVDNLRRTPFEHQNIGIQWILSRFDIGQKSEKGTCGGLLADDMGLGKTFMSLVAIEEILKRTNNSKPVLVVGPLSLLENWEKEVQSTFKISPFSDVVVLQSSRDLKRFQVYGAKPETHKKVGEKSTQKDAFANVNFALKVGEEFGPYNLARPGRLVLTSYDTLRNYQFSLSRIDWSVVVFDEAQNLKNPNAIVTRAAKALKADLVLLVTGTPIENTLADLWCLMDTAMPGLLDAWQEFRVTHVQKISKAQAKRDFEETLRLGKELRAVIGDSMLRRTKEDQLQGLPKKVIYSPHAVDDKHTVVMPELGQTMQGEQLRKYNGIIAAVVAADIDTRKRLALVSLERLKVASIHHDLNDPEISHTEIQPLDSCKIKAMDAILDQIYKRDEKVIIFAISKRVQSLLSIYLQDKYKIIVPIINGDIQAVSGNPSCTNTRAKLLEKFQQKPGFGIIILSPIAMGVGITIVGANNVIHMERHWNPAKEDQATDRVYRIGQKRQVNVYLPMALHPTTQSFDEKIDVLLRRKIDLSTAVVAAEHDYVKEMESLFDQAEPTS